MSQGSIEDSRNGASKAGILVHTHRASNLPIEKSSSFGDIPIESRIVSKLRSSVEISSTDRLSPSTILSDPLFASDMALSSLNIDEAMLPLTHSTTDELEHLNSNEELEEKNEVSTVRLKLAAAKLQDFHHVDNHDSLPPTIWSFDKFSHVDEETQCLLQDIDKTIQALKNRPHSATKFTSTSTDICFQDDQSGEEFPETSSLINGDTQEIDSQNSSEVFVAKFQALLQQATYQPDASLQWQVDDDRLQRFQHILSNAVNEEEEDDQEDEETDSIEESHRSVKHQEKMSSFDQTANKVEMSRIDYESKNATSNWCLDQQQQMLLAELEMDREMAALTAALTQSAYELDAIDKFTS